MGDKDYFYKVCLCKFMCQLSVSGDNSGSPFPCIRKETP